MKQIEREEKRKKEMDEKISAKLKRRMFAAGRAVVETITLGSVYSRRSSDSLPKTPISKTPSKSAKSPLSILD